VTKLSNELNLTDSLANDSLDSIVHVVEAVDATIVRKLKYVVRSGGNVSTD